MGCGEVNFSFMASIYVPLRKSLVTHSDKSRYAGRSAYRSIWNRFENFYTSSALTMFYSESDFIQNDNPKSSAFNHLMKTETFILYIVTRHFQAFTET